MYRPVASRQQQHDDSNRNGDWLTPGHDNVDVSAETDDLQGLGAEQGEPSQQPATTAGQSGDVLLIEACEVQGIVQGVNIRSLVVLDELPQDGLRGAAEPGADQLQSAHARSGLASR